MCPFCFAALAGLGAKALAAGGGIGLASRLAGKRFRQSLLLSADSEPGEDHETRTGASQEDSR